MDLSSKELDNRNSAALNQLADLVENVSMMSLTATKLLYEKGLELSFRNQQVSGTASRARSRTSIRSSGRNSECSFTLNSQDDGIISRCMNFDSKFFNRCYEILTFLFSIRKDFFEFIFKDIE